MVDNGEVPKEVLAKLIKVPKKEVPALVRDAAKLHGLNETELLRHYDLLRTREIAQELHQSTLLTEEIDWAGRMLTRGQLSQLPEVDPLIEGIIDKESLAILAGRDSTYKSFVATDWALSIATETKWQGRPVTQGKVLYILGEGHNDFNRRVEAWELANKVQVDEENFLVLNRPPNLFTGVGFEGFLEKIQELEFGFVVIDTLRRVSGGANENSSDMGIVTDRINEIKNALSGGTVLTVAHTNKSNTDTRGHSSIEDDSDIVWTTRSNDSGTTVSLINTKQKYRESAQGYKLEPIKSGSSLVLGYGQGSSTDRRDGESMDKLKAMAVKISAFVIEQTADDKTSGLSKTTIEKGINGDDKVKRAAVDWLVQKKVLYNVAAKGYAKFISLKPYDGDEPEEDFEGTFSI